MKTAEAIINHLFPNSQSKFLFHRCVAQLIALLPAIMRQSIVFCYQNSGVLTFVIDNPALVTEFNYKQNLIKLLLKELAAQGSACRVCTIDKVRAYYKPIPPVTAPAPRWEEKITERATGEFANEATDPAIHAKIEKIRTAIRTEKKDETMISRQSLA